MQIISLLVKGELPIKQIKYWLKLFLKIIGLTLSDKTAKIIK